VPGADIRFVQGDVAEVHAAMRAASDARNIWLVGGGDLVGQFADQGLLDEIFVSVAPVTLGGGAPLLPRRIVGRMTLTGIERDRQFANLTYSVDT
jgi:dihydrofolate reductase